MSTLITAITTAEACPAWCTRHLQAADEGMAPIHSTAVTADGLALDFDQDPAEDDGPVFMPPDAHNGLALHEARRYARALLEACDLIDGDKAGRRVA
jgi:hypothetical protein